MPCHCGSRSTRVLKLSLLSNSFQNQAYNHSGVLAMPRTTFKEKVPKRHLDQMPEPPQLAPFDVEQRLLSKSTSSLSLSSLWKAPSRTTEGSIQLFWGLRRNLQIIRLKFTGAHLDRMVGSNMHRTFCRKSVIRVFFLHQHHHLIQHLLNSSLHWLTTAASIMSVTFGITYNTTKQSRNMADVNNLDTLVTGVLINPTANKIMQEWQHVYLIKSDRCV